MHNVMNKKFNKDHPNIYTFIEGIKKLQQKYDVKMLHLRVGARFRLPSLKYRKIDQKIVSLKEELMRGTRTVIEYLDAVKHQVHLHD